VPAQNILLAHKKVKRYKNTEYRWWEYAGLPLADPQVAVHSIKILLSERSMKNGF